MSRPTQGPITAVIDHGAGEQEPVVRETVEPALPSETLPEPSTAASTMPSIPLGTVSVAAAPTPVAVPVPMPSSLPNAPGFVEAAPKPALAPYVPPAPAVVVQAPRPAAASPATRASGTPHSAGAPPLPRDGPVPRIGLVQSDFHHDVTSAMAGSALAKAAEFGAPVQVHLHVRGAFDIPLAAQALLERSDVDAVVCIGCIVKGQTGHDVLIAREVARKLADLATAMRKAVGLGVTGPEMTLEQAWARVGSGAYAVEAVVAQHRAVLQAA